MNVTIKKTNKLARTLTITVDREQLEKDRAELYKTLGKKLKVPGFREGSAPTELLEKHHAKVLREEFLKWAIPSYYEQALKTEALLPVGLPHISDVEYTAGKLEFNAEIELKPEPVLETSMYRGIKIKSPMPKVSSEELKKLMKNVRENIQKVLKKEVTDEDAARWSGYAGENDLKEAARIELESAMLRQRRQEVENQLVTALLKKVSIDVPARIVDEQTAKLVNQESYGLRAKGVPDEDIQKSRKDLEDKCRPIAADQVKLYYILEAIAAREVLEVDTQNLYERVTGYLLSVAEYK